MFALKNNELFDTFVKKAAAREKEISVTVQDEVHNGFVSGLDQDWLQITTTKEVNRVLINIVNIIDIRETGRTINSLRKSNPHDAASIYEFTQLLREKAKGDRP